MRDSFVQQFGLQSVAKSKLSELVHFCHAEAEKGRAAACSRVLLLHRFMGLREKKERADAQGADDEIENSIEGVAFTLHLVQGVSLSFSLRSCMVCVSLSFFVLVQCVCVCVCLSLCSRRVRMSLSFSVLLQGLSLLLSL